MSKIHTTWKVDVKNSGSNLSVRVPEPDRNDLLNKAYMHTTSSRSTGFNNNIKQLLKTSSLSTIQNIETLLEENQRKSINLNKKVKPISNTTSNSSSSSLSSSLSSSSSSSVANLSNNVTSLDNLRNNLHIMNSSVPLEQKQQNNDDETINDANQQDDETEEKIPTNNAGLTVYHLDYPKTADMFRANARRMRQPHGGIKLTDYGFVDAL